MKLICERHIPRNYRDEETSKRYWAVSEGLNVLDPDRFSMIRKDVLDKALARGTQVHLIFSDILATRAKIPGYDFKLERVPAVLRGYATGLYEWADKHNVRPLMIESSSAFRRWGYAGTADALAIVDGVETIVELKSGIEERLNRVQVQAYHKMEGYEGAKRLLLLYVDKNGHHKPRPVDPSPHDWAWFCSSLGVLTGRMNG